MELGFIERSGPDGASKQWKVRVAQISSLASDLAALAALIKASASQFDVGMIFRDLAEVKEKAGLPATYSQYGADYFVDPTDSDRGDRRAAQPSPVRTARSIRSSACVSRRARRYVLPTPAISTYGGAASAVNAAPARPASPAT